MQIFWIRLPGKNPAIRFFGSDASRKIYGPGHNCFVKSEDGSKDLMIYHARTETEIIGDPLYNPNRHAMIMEVKWAEDGTPVFSIRVKLPCRFCHVPALPHLG